MAPPPASSPFFAQEILQGKARSARPAGNLAPVLALLRRNPDLRALFFAQIVSFAGDWFATVAMLGLVIDRTGSDLAGLPAPSSGRRRPSASGPAS